MKREKLRVTRYEIISEVDLKIALVSDLHGRRPDDCLIALRAEEPDIICVAGDILETTKPEDAPQDREHRSRFLHRLFKLLDLLLLRRERRPASRENAMRFLSGAAAVAPVYYTPGNHDQWLTREDRDEIAQSGAVLLENAASAIHVRGKTIVLGGIVTERGAAWLRKFSRKPGYKILLCHRPEFYEMFIKQLPLPLVFSGHAHGGQWRIFNRGIFAPGQGLFPRYTKGVYDNRLVVSAGLANTANVPRINNPLELVVVQLRRGK